MRIKTRSLAIFAGVATGLVLLSGCSSEPSLPESQVPTGEVQQDKVRLLTAEEMAVRDNGVSRATGVNAVLAKGDCELSVNLAYSSQEVGTHSENHASEEDHRDRAVAYFVLDRTRSQACSSELSAYLSGLQIVAQDGEKISEYQQAYVHKPTSTESNVYEDDWGGAPKLGPKSSGNAALEIKADKFSPDMKLVLETPDGDFTVEAQNWTKPSEDYSDEMLIENGACLAGEKL